MLTLRCRNTVAHIINNASQTVDGQAVHCSIGSSWTCILHICGSLMGTMLAETAAAAEMMMMMMMMTERLYCKSVLYRGARTAAI